MRCSILMKEKMLTPLKIFILHSFCHGILPLLLVQHFWNRNSNDGMYLHYHSCFWNYGNFSNLFLGNGTILLASFFQTIVSNHYISNYHVIRIKWCLNCDRFTHIVHFFSSISLRNPILFCNMFAVLRR